MLITKDTSFMFSSHSVAVPVSHLTVALAVFSADDSFCSEQVHKDMAGEAESHFTHTRKECLSGSCSPWPRDVRIPTANI